MVWLILFVFAGGVLTLAVVVWLDSVVVRRMWRAVNKGIAPQIPIVGKDGGANFQSLELISKLPCRIEFSQRCLPLPVGRGEGAIRCAVRISADRISPSREFSNGWKSRRREFPRVGKNRATGNERRKMRPYGTKLRTRLRSSQRGIPSL